MPKGAGGPEKKRHIYMRTARTDPGGAIKTYVDTYTFDNTMRFVAHVLLSNGTVRRLAAYTETAGLQANKRLHADQLFWITHDATIRGNLPAAAASISQLILDVSLPPCDIGMDSCQRQVPALLNACFRTKYADATDYSRTLDIRIYTHRMDWVATTSEPVALLSAAGNTWLSAWDDENVRYWDWPVGRHPGY